MIINSLLDTDFYKFSMGYYAYKYYPDVTVKYSFTNRTKDVKLGNLINIDKLKAEIYHVSTLRFIFDELQFLRKQGIFSVEYLRFLNTLRLPPVYIRVEKNGTLIIETEGTWSEAIFWETIIISIVNEMYFNQLTVENPEINVNQDIYVPNGRTNLELKIKKIDEKPFKFADFGTRRRLSHYWQGYVLERLKLNVNSKSFLGTSNVYFAKKLGLKPIGTFAHELLMIVCGINPDNMKAHHNQALSRWYNLYGEKLSIALTDTYGTEFFFKEGLEYPDRWNGLRQDSGDPFDFASNAIDYYKNLGINPKEKTIIFSDGLDVDKIIELENSFKGYIKLAYGWGTNLTNDCGVEPLSLVMKATEANGNSLVKLSDNLAKAVGNQEEIRRYKKVFGYTNTFKETTKY